MATGFKPGVQNNTKLFTVLSHCTLVDEAKNVVTFYDDDVLAGRPVENHVNLLAYADGKGFSHYDGSALCRMLKTR